MTHPEFHSNEISCATLLGLSYYLSKESFENLLSAHEFLIYEHLTPEEMTEQYFEKYNKANPDHPMSGFDNVNYCLAVRK